MVVQTPQPFVYTEDITMAAAPGAGTPTLYASAAPVQSDISSGYILKIYDISCDIFSSGGGTVDADISIIVGANAVPQNPMDIGIIDAKLSKTLTFTSPIEVSWVKPLTFNARNHNTVGNIRVKVTITGEVVEE